MRNHRKALQRKGSTYLAAVALITLSLHYYALELRGGSAIDGRSVETTIAGT
jgi:hypothetical protein